MARDSDHDDSTYEQVNIGSRDLPPDMTSRRMAIAQGHDTTPSPTDEGGPIEELDEDDE